MGTLTPGATYTYEYEDGITYAKEEGKTRFVIGWEYQSKKLNESKKENSIWDQIVFAAKSDQRLQEELNRVKMFYHLSKTDGKK